ncbi:aldolase [Granulosicoccus sp. 3-233]|uniref:aldolase n=1 Tax=Granulosicoccus sp. 3-233 TaxID=3417969 RepID=UPI003D344C3A
MASSSEQQDRNDLALAFRLAERFGFHEGICNHFSLRLDGDRERYLINPYGVHWSRIQPDSLLLIDGDGQVLAGEGAVEDTALFIHVASHRANPRHKVVLHTHMPYATTLTMLDGEAGILPMTHQTAIRFHGRLAREPEYGGLAHDNQEGERIARKAAQAPAIDIMFLANHGVVVSGQSVSMAFDDLYYLERACRQHVLALQTGQALKLIPTAVVERTASQFNRDLAVYAEQHFRALEQVLTTDPDFNFTF